MPFFVQLLQACISWEDYLWAYFKVMVDVRVEQVNQFLICCIFTDILYLFVYFKLGHATEKKKAVLVFFFEQELRLTVRTDRALENLSSEYWDQL